MTEAVTQLQTLLTAHGGQFPHQLALRYPHVIAQLLARWNSKPALESYLTDLLIPARFGRLGFPAEVAAEIMALQKGFDAARPASGDFKDVLLSPEEARDELSRRGVPRTLNHFVRAAEAGDHAACLLFIGSGFDVNCRDGRHWTPLMMAAFNGKEVLALKLIEQGADVHAQDNRGYTPMHWAAFNGYARVIELLVSKGAAVNNPSQAGITPLMQAAARAHLEACTELLNHGAKPNMVAGNGATALLKAVANGNLAVINLLLSVGARVDAELDKGKSLIEIAMSSRIPEIRARISAAAERKKPT